MKKHDEIELFRAVAGECRNGYLKREGPWPMDVAEWLGMPHKRAVYLFEKWADQGIYEYGTSAEHGWVTPKGFESLGER